MGFVDSIKILSYLKRIFGLNIGAMFHNKVSHSKKTLWRVRNNYSILWLVYALWLHVTHLTMFCKTISFAMNVKVSILDFGLDMMFTIVGALSMVVTIVWSIKNTNRLMSLKLSMESFDHKFKMFGKSVDNKLSRNFSISEMIVVMLFWTFYFSYYVIWNCENGTLKCFRNWFVTYHPHKIVLVAFVEELALLYGLTVRFRSLNELLLNMEMDAVADLSYRFLPSKVNPKNSGPLFKTSGCTKLVHCRELHFFLCDLCSDLNSMVSLQTVANILGCFVNIFVMLYLACFGYSRDVENSTANTNPLGIFLPLTIGGEAFTKIYYLAKHCTLVQFEAKRTGEILHKISMYSLNDNIKNEVVAAVTTFIVILIQFAMAIKYTPGIVVPTMITDVTETIQYSTIAT
ncbi:uncharacterized protein LOC143917825 isoform X2 [Arctopsyche grandis]|uniref:uncharacterized protein LOC143917825 isoform X2 n=1 Tax=Arctopsyche grandis TaxID=121162 RepID=UPI00406D9C7B